MALYCVGYGCTLDQRHNGVEPCREGVRVWDTWAEMSSVPVGVVTSVGRGGVIVVESVTSYLQAVCGVGEIMEQQANKHVLLHSTQDFILASK